MGAGTLVSAMQTTLERSVNVKQAAFIVVALGGLCATVIFCFFDEDKFLCETDPAICPCLELLPSNKDFGVSYGINSSSSKLVDVKFSARKENSADLSEEIADTFVQCIKEVRDGVEIINFARIGTSPIGQVADEWLGETGLQIELRWRDNEKAKIINNLEIGPRSGQKWQILEEWCSDENMGRCVECSDLDSGAEAVAVKVKLREESEFRRVFWSDNWATDREHQLWDDIDEDGKRYLYECAA